MDIQIDELENELEELEAQIHAFHKKNENLKNKISRLQSVRAKTPLDEQRVHFNDSLIYKEMERRGIALEYISQTPLVEAKYQGHIEFLFNTTSRLIPYVDALILENKGNTKELLKEKGYPVAEAKAFDPDDVNKAQTYAHEQLHYPVVIKPTNGSGGHFVYCNIQSDSEFRRAYSALSKVTFTSSIMVEKFIADVDDYRFFLINGKTASVVKRTPPMVIGDGHSTLQQLVEAENFRRMNPRNTCLCPIQIDDFESERCLKAQGVTHNTILKVGEKIQCRFNANVSMGGECETFKHKIHPSYFDVVASIQQLFPRLPVLVIDLLIQDPSLEANKENYWVCECCCINPGLSLHTHPSRGEGDDIISPLVDLLFPETALRT